MQIQPSRAERPYLCMTICALEVCTLSLLRWSYVPTSTSLVGYQGFLVELLNVIYKGGIDEDAL